MVTRESLLSKHHLLLPKSVASIARDYSRRASQMCHSHMGGGTSLGNGMWHRFMRPALARAEQAMKKSSDLHGALGHLLGMVMIGINDDTWLRDQEEYCDWDSFEGYFSALSATWQALLAKDDATLGLTPPRGKMGGYREDLLKLLSGWESDVNDILEEHDEFADEGSPARLRATVVRPAPKAKMAKGKAAAPPPAAKASQHSPPRETRSVRAKRAKQTDSSAPLAAYDY